MNKKAIVLMSGGLDSALATKMIFDMGIEIVGAHFTGPFCQCNRGKGGCISYAKAQAEDLGFTFKTIPLGTAYIDIVKDPAHGYGSGVNPCIDCRIMMLRQAKKLMEDEGASFVVTGEVIGQRPMSQLKHKLQIIESESGLERLILRPLCAQHMPETIPEEEGIVDRSKLLSIQGRRRKEQMDLAEMLKIGDYPCPAGGCLLTDKSFSRKVKDAIAHNNFEITSIALLKAGRHFRLSDKTKVVVGRNEDENSIIKNLAKDGDTVLDPSGTPGPTALIKSTSMTDEELNTAASIVSAYCDKAETVTVNYTQDGVTESKSITHGNRDDYKDLRI